MREVIMGYQGEMSLKGLNRNQFESTMMKILRYRLKTVGKFRVYCTQSTFYMEPEEEDIVTSSVVNLVFEPEWDKDMMSEEAKLELGFL